MDANVFHAFESQRLQHFVESHQRSSEQWNGFIIRITYQPEEFNVPGIHRTVDYFRMFNGNMEFSAYRDRHVSVEDWQQAGWQDADAADPNNPVWQDFPYAEKHNICVRIREAALLCTVVEQAVVIMSCGALAPSFYLFIHLRKGIPSTRDSILAFIAAMKRVKNRFAVKRFWPTLPDPHTGRPASLPKTSLGDLRGEGWALVTSRDGVRTPWPAFNGLEVPESVAAAGFGADNPASVACMTEAATPYVAQAIASGNSQQVLDIIVPLAPGAAQQMLAVWERFYTEHGVEVLQTMLDRYARDAAAEDAYHLRAGKAVAEREKEELRVQHDQLLTEVAQMRAARDELLRKVSAEKQLF
ncbi:hypothetical protein JKP88DRAFT_268592 [Tribonema minus]|uniref:Uncharacterized protein n=2 Tax=Tribonema minus TaxID=303371 RepID=A0A835YZJ2_9STRA|nr:hypothetical protein JKP88DRAFT_268798 [Tribonema minus]KAG5184290.1 hypothetical protein JKP88DRAFT_268592 [Tribonema minus]